MTYEELVKANDTIKTTPIKGKNYAEVPQRVKAFRMLHPNGGISTEIVSLQNGVAVIKATAFDEAGNILGVGHAYEKEGNGFINKESYIENCETSAVGRALGMCGFGIDTSVASYEEVTNAINNQEEPKATPNQIEILKKCYTGDKMTKLLEANGITAIEDISLAKASELIGKLKKKVEDKSNG